MIKATDEDKDESDEEEDVARARIQSKFVVVAKQKDDSDQKYAAEHCIVTFHKN